MERKLFDSERKVMEVMWETDAPLTAKEIAVPLASGAPHPTARAAASGSAATASP